MLIARIPLASAHGSTARCSWPAVTSVLAEQVHSRGIAVFLVEQNVRQSLAIAHNGYVISKGRVVASGTSRQLLESPEVRGAYFGEAKSSAVGLAPNR